MLGRRPPLVPLLPDAVGVETTEAVHAMGLHALAQKMSVSYDNPLLNGYTREPDDSKWQPKVRYAVECARDQYGSPCVLCAAEHIKTAIAPPGSDVPAAAKVSAPIYGVASKQETAEGETADKMESWAKLTSSTFEMLARDVDAAHMDLPQHPKTVELVLATLKPHLAQA